MNTAGVVILCAAVAAAILAFLLGRAWERDLERPYTQHQMDQRVAQAYHLGESAGYANAFVDEMDDAALDAEIRHICERGEAS